MGFIGDLFGGGNKGTGFQAAGADLINPFNYAPLNDTLKAQGQAIGFNQNSANALAASGGIGNQSSVFNQQQQLANQLQAQSQGQGPNLGAAMLANATGQNVAQQAALMGSQRGVGANAGMLARQAAQQGAGIQQQAAGQAAQMRIQQQLAAQQALAQQQASMGQLAGQQVGQQLQAGNQYANQLSNLYGQQLAATGQLNQAQVANVASQNSANAAVASQNAKTQGGIFGGIANGLGGALGSVIGGGGSSGGGLQPSSSIQPVEGSGGGQPLNVAYGGMIPQQMNCGGMAHYAQGGQVDPSQPQSFAAKFMSGLYDDTSSGQGSNFGSAFDPVQVKPQQGPGLGDVLGGILGGGTGLIGKGLGILGPLSRDAGRSGETGQQGMPSDAGGVYTPGKPGDTGIVGPTGGALPGQGNAAGSPLHDSGYTPGVGYHDPTFASGGKVPGQAPMQGDSLKNDLVPAMLSPGEIVIPRSHAMDPEAAAAFARAVVMRNRKK